MPVKGYMSHNVPCSDGAKTREKRRGKQAPVTVSGKRRGGRRIVGSFETRDAKKRKVERGAGYGGIEERRGLPGRHLPHGNLACRRQSTGLRECYCKTVFVSHAGRTARDHPWLRRHGAVTVLGSLPGPSRDDHNSGQR